MWEGLSAFEHAQCTLLACGLPLVKSSLPCSLSLLCLPWLAVLLYSIFLFHGSFDPVCRCLQGVLVGPTLRPPLTGLLLRLPRRPPLVPCHCRRVPCPPLVPFRLPLVFIGVEMAVAELWSFRPHRGLSLPHHWRMTLSPLAIASSP